MKVRFKIFSSQFASHEKVFDKVAEFATQVGRDRLVSIAHSEDKGSLVATVWYWGEEEEKTAGSGVRKVLSGIMTIPQPKKEPEGLSQSAPPEPAPPPPTPVLPPAREPPEVAKITMTPWQ